MKTNPLQKIAKIIKMILIEKEKAQTIEMLIAINPRKLQLQQV